MSTDDALNSLTQISRVIAETASDGIITIDENSTILFANRATEKIFGYSRDELMGHSLTMLMPEYLRHVHRAGLTRYISTGERHISWEAVELPGLHKNGSELPLELSFGEFVEGGKHFFTGIVRDITDRKRGEEALRQSEEHLRALIENAADIITVLNRDGTRQYVSPSVEHSIGYRPEELIGKSPFELVHPDNAAELRQLFTRGKSPTRYLTRRFASGKDGSWRIHEATAHNLLDDPAVNGIVVNSRDMTDRKRLEYRLTMQYQTARILAESPSLDAAGAASCCRRFAKASVGISVKFGSSIRKREVLRWLASWHDPAVTVAEFEEAAAGRPFRARGRASGQHLGDGAGALVQRSRQQTRIFRAGHWLPRPVCAQLSLFRSSWAKKFSA